MNRQQQQIARKIRTEKLQNARIINPTRDEQIAAVANFCKLWGENQKWAATEHIKALGLSAILDFASDAGRPLANACSELLNAIKHETDQVVFVKMQNVSHEIDKLHR